MLLPLVKQEQMEVQVVELVEVRDQLQLQVDLEIHPLFLLHKELMVVQEVEHLLTIMVVAEVELLVLEQKENHQILVDQVDLEVLLFKQVLQDVMEHQGQFQVQDILLVVVEEEELLKDL